MCGLDKSKVYFSLAGGREGQLKGDGSDIIHVLDFDFQSFCTMLRCDGGFIIKSAVLFLFNRGLFWSTRYRVFNCIT